MIRATEGPIERERRRSTRVGLRCRVSIESDKDRLDGVTVDLSLGGLLVQSKRLLAPGTRVTVSLELEAGRASLPLNARIISTVGTDRMDIKFENLGANESKLLQEFLLPLILAAT